MSVTTRTVVPPEADDYAELFRWAAADSGGYVSGETLSAICWRESHYGKASVPPDPSGVGDNGHGHGLMRIDDRTWSDWLGANAWWKAEINIPFGARILVDTYKAFIAEKYPYPLEMAIGSYNFGPAVARHVVGQLTRPYSRDSLVAHLNAHSTAGTAGGPGDYVSDVFGRIALLHLHFASPNRSTS